MDIYFHKMNAEWLGCSPWMARKIFYFVLYGCCNRFLSRYIKESGGLLYDIPIEDIRVFIEEEIVDNLEHILEDCFVTSKRKVFLKWS